MPVNYPKYYLIFIWSAGLEAIERYRHEDVSSRQRRDMSIEIGDVGKGTPAACYVKIRAFG